MKVQVEKIYDVDIKISMRQYELEFLIHALRCASEQKSGHSLDVRNVCGDLAQRLEPGR